MKTENKSPVVVALETAINALESTRHSFCPVDQKRISDTCHQLRVMAHEKEQGERPSTPLTFEDAIRITRNCMTYSGGYVTTSREVDIYRNGIRTVVNCLESALYRANPEEPFK